MSKFKCEMFSHFVYSEELTYQELLDKENELSEALREILTSCGASHMSFFQDGDSFMAQCVFTSFDQQVFHTICEHITPILSDKVAAKILFVDKYLDKISLCVADNNAWYESTLNMPANVADLLASSEEQQVDSSESGDSAAPQIVSAENNDSAEHQSGSVEHQSESAEHQSESTELREDPSLQHAEKDDNNTQQVDSAENGSNAVQNMINAKSVDDAAKDE